MTWQVALFLAVCSLFALAYIIAIASMLALAISNKIAQACHWAARRLL